MNKKHSVVVLPGDGIGPEVMRAATRVLLASGAPLDLIEVPFSAPLLSKTDRIPDEIIDAIKSTGAALKAPTGTLSGVGRASLNVELRKRLDLYANIRPIETMPGVRTRFNDVHIDMVIVRENTEDLYAGDERVFHNGDVDSIAHFTVAGCRRIAKAAFEHARKNDRGSVTVVHKANIIKKGHGLFLRMAREVAKDYGDIELKDMLGDNFTAQIIRDPSRFEVVVTPNLFGDLFSDEAAQTIGGLGFAPGLNQGDACVIAEAVHGTADDIVGLGIANPTALILSGVMLLKHLGEMEAANRITDALREIYRDGSSLPGDVKHSRIGKNKLVGTEPFTDLVISNMQAAASAAA